METPFDRIVEAIQKSGFHNHRRPEHSDIVAHGLFEDLKAHCPRIADDFESGTIGRWFDVAAPGARGRRIDLFVGKPDKDGLPAVSRARICVENKSLITAHRNKTNRLDDLDDVLHGIHREKPEAIIVATVLIGTALQVLNVPDGVKSRYKKRKDVFENEVRPRLSSGDQTLWEEFDFAISENKKNEPAKSVEAFRTLPTRPPGQTHQPGYDFVMLVPVFIDNVNTPRVDRENELGIDVDAQYSQMLETICAAYQARWHL